MMRLCSRERGLRRSTQKSVMLTRSFVYLVVVLVIYTPCPISKSVTVLHRILAFDHHDDGISEPFRSIHIRLPVLTSKWEARHE